MKKSQLIMLAGALLLGSLFWLPLWNITLEAPQYPDAIGMDIYINRFEGTNPNDIKNINIMNHYVGMKDIPEVIPEFGIFPWVTGGMIFLGLLFAFIGKRWMYITWFTLLLALGSIAMYDFYLWEYDYGHDLKETAAIKFTDEQGNPMAYQPPLIGNKVILNFRALSWPRAGAYLLFTSLMLSAYAFASSRKKSARINESIVAALVTLLISSCEVKPQEIAYGQDACGYCKMTIVDKQHSAQVVTTKGKAFKYDAVECMMNHIRDWEEQEIKYFLVASFNDPGKLVDAQNAHYLITEHIPSPMGKFLTAFEQQANRDELHREYGGSLLDWEGLKYEFNLKN